MNNMLYKIPKDILVELVCKSFDNLSYEEILTIFKSKAKSELQKKKEFLLKIHVHLDFIVQFGSRYLILRKIPEPDSILEVLLPRNITEKCIFINIGIKTIGCKTEIEMIDCLSQILLENANREQVNNIIALFQSLIQCYNDRRKIKNILKLIGKFYK
jgi:hypothetical protein